MWKKSRLFSTRSDPAWRYFQLTVAVLVGAGTIASTPVQAAIVATSSVAGSLHSEGVVDLKALAAATVLSAGQPSSGLAAALNAGATDFHATPPRGFKLRRAYSPADETARAPHATAQGNMVTGVGAQSFVGLDHFDQRILADNGNQLTIEPPNPTLAVGAGFVVEAVDNALQVYDKAASPCSPRPSR